jgi:hypothetical protein
MNLFFSPPFVLDWREFLLHSSAASAQQPASQQLYSLAFLSYIDDELW